jgi:hypothetical protein
MPLYKKAANAIADFCSVSFNAYYSQIEANSNSFTRVLFSTLTDFSIVDPNSNYNQTDDVYIVPKNGYYQITTIFRLTDYADPAVGFGQGANTSESDNPFFLWGYTNPSRQGSLNVRTSYFNALDEIRMIYYVDGSSYYIGGSMSVVPLG